MPDDTELDWNIGVARIKFIGKIVNTVRKAYVQAKFNNYQFEDVLSYHTFVDALWQEIRQYSGEQEYQDKPIQEVLDELVEKLEQTGYTPKNVFMQLRDVEQEIQRIRNDEGLDIPRKTKLDPETAAVDGLIN